MAKAAPLSWFRVELAADGTLISCRRVEGSARDGARVFYRQARTDEAAGRLAFLAYQRAENGRRRRRYIKEKRCPYCGRPQDRESGKRCSVCLEHKTADRLRYEARQRGEIVEKPDPKVARKERREGEDAALRLSILEEIDSIWSTRGNIGLRQWLRNELRALRGKAVA